MYSRRRPTFFDGTIPRRAQSSTVEVETCSSSATSAAVITSAADSLGDAREPARFVGSHDPERSRANPGTEGGGLVPKPDVTGRDLLISLLLTAKRRRRPSGFVPCLSGPC